MDVEELAKWGGHRRPRPVFVGFPTTIADILQDWQEDTDVETGSTSLMR